MTCYSPVLMFKLDRRHPSTGNYVYVHYLTPRDRCLVLEEIHRACGGCVGCRLSHSVQWSIRCMHESSLHDSNSFITLTFAPEHLPEDRGLHHFYYQDFMKRLRDRLNYIPLRYYMCGEYGSKLSRPHFHACIFGYDFPDRILWRNHRGNNLYVSPLLSDLWPFGFSTIGEMNFMTAAYVARYCLKKITGAPAAQHYEWVDPTNGVIYSRRPDYSQPSLKPGLARGWFDKFKSDVYPHDRVVLNGKLYQPPKYYDRCFEADYPLDMEEIKFLRLDKSKVYQEHQSRERLRVREQVKLSQISILKRPYDDS